MKSKRKVLLTGAIVLVAVGLVLIKTWTHITNPWTRDGQVQANVIQIAPRVSGPIVALPIRDNQRVRAGDLLFQIDPRTYQASLDQARAVLDQTSDNVAVLIEQVEVAKAEVEVSRSSIDQAKSGIAQLEANLTKNKAELERQQTLLPKKATSQKAVERAEAIYQISVEELNVGQSALLQTQSNLLKAQAGLAESEARLGALGDSNPQLRQALAALRQAELNLEFTEVRAPADGHITNLRKRIGSPVVANQPCLALVDTSIWWVDGFFKENRIEGIRPGDSAVITLMSYPDQPIEAYVDSLGWGIYQKDGSSASDLLPQVSPTFEWIRLAQRIPVRIEFDEIPEGIELRVGTTCSVLVRTGSGTRRADTTSISNNK